MQRDRKVLEVAIKVVSKEDGIIAYKNSNNKLVETLITKGNCKLQWKVDWAMRWSALDIDYEMNGKDLIPSFDLSKQISRFIYGKVPVNMAYELFLDQNGEKISKSKGNGLSIDEWLKNTELKKALPYLCIRILDGQKDYILIAYQKAWMIIKKS